MHSDLAILPHQADGMTPSEVALAFEGEKQHVMEGFTPRHPLEMESFLEGLRSMTMAERVAWARSQ